MSDDYADILSRGWDDIPESQLLPIGTWRMKGIRATYKEPAAADQNPYIMFVYSPIEPLGDVDEDEMNDLPEGYEPAGERVFYRIWLETARDWDAVRSHLRKHGIDLTGRNVKDTLDAFAGTEVNAWLGVRNFVDKAGEERSENDPSAFAALDD